MNNLWTRLGALTRKIVGDEAYLFFGYVFIVFRPGAAPPALPSQNAVESADISLDWTPENYKLFIDEARIDVANQQADKRDIRARAQLVLTTAIALGGALVASLGGAQKGICAGDKVLYGLAGTAIGLAALAAGGIISARSDIGAVSVPALTYYGSAELQRKVATGYASTRMAGARTIASLVTVLRDCVLAIILGAALLAVAHLKQ